MCPFLALLAVLGVLGVLGGVPAGAAGGGLEGIPRFSHVVVLVLENESFASTWGTGSVATYLNGLRSRGVLADHYYGTGHLPYGQLAADLAADSLPALSFITPDTCHDGHDMPTCADGSPGGLAAADLWLSQNVPALLDYLTTHNGLLLITFDEASSSDTSGCCTGGPGGGPGAGGRVGLLALSPAVPAGGVVSTPYDHASLLRTLEDSFGISEHLNNAGTATAMKDLFTVATHLLVSAPANAAAGSPFTVNVAALDDAGHIATSYSTPTAGAAPGSPVGAAAGH